MELSRRFMRRWSALIVFAHLVACSAGGGGAKSVSSGGGVGGDSGVVEPQGGSAGVGEGGGLNFGGNGPVMTAGDGGHVKHCDDAGNCSCVTIASIGHEGVWGPCSSDNTIAFQNWLNTQSTARVDNYDTTKPALT